MAKKKKTLRKRAFSVGERSENSADTKVSAEGEAGAGVPLQPVEQTMLGQAMPLQPMEAHGGADLHLQPVEVTPSWSRWMPEESCEPIRSPRWSRLLAAPVDVWREKPMLEQGKRVRRKEQQRQCVMN